VQIDWSNVPFFSSYLITSKNKIVANSTIKHTEAFPVDTLVQLRGRGAQGIVGGRAPCYARDLADQCYFDFVDRAGRIHSHVVLAILIKHLPVVCMVRR
jgi:hypothetical protein